MNVSLTPQLEEYVREKVASGLYNNASEVLREALRLLFEREGATPAKLIPAPLRKGDVLARLAALEKPLRKRGITSLSLFGSHVQGKARPNSDIDLIIDVDREQRFSLVDLVSLKDFLEDRLGKSVDLVTKDGLDPHIRNRVLREAEAVF